MKTTARTLLALLPFLATVCLAQTPVSEEEAAKDLERICTEVLCRDPTTVRVLREDGSTMEVPIRIRLPFLQPDGWMTIFPGEEIFVEVDVDGDRITNPRAVRKAENPSTTLTFKFWQEPKRKDSFLLVTNPFSRPVKFNLGMMLLNDEHLRKTSSCPVLPQKKHYEHWPHPIFQLVVANLRFLPDGAELNCEN
jgi:hypothetical protein